MGQSGMPEKVSSEAMTRLALGTAQFGLNYGLANFSGQVTQAEVGVILNRAATAGIDTLDTAIAYGQGEACLGRAGMTGWRVITKLPPLPQEVTDVREWVDEQIGGSLRRLGIAQLEAVLLHRSSDLLGPLGEAYVGILNEMKAAGLTRALGVSIYDPVELDRLWPKWSPDVVQAPCNVLDRRLIHSGWLDRLNRNGVRVHVRSAFLQGLLLMAADCRPGGFARWKDILDRWMEWCKEREISPLRGALAFVLALRGVEFVVIGVNSDAQLEECLAHSSAVDPLPPDDMFSEDRNLIDPSRWKVA
jgi:aryl-alcohol dehydrogenase-like predicted oxidoreductase